MKGMELHIFSPKGIWKLYYFIKQKVKQHMASPSLSSFCLYSHRFRHLSIYCYLTVPHCKIYQFKRDICFFHCLVLYTVDLYVLSYAALKSINNRYVTILFSTSFHQSAIEQRFDLWLIFFFLQTTVVLTDHHHNKVQVGYRLTQQISYMQHWEEWYLYSFCILSGLLSCSPQYHFSSMDSYSQMLSVSRCSSLVILWPAALILSAPGALFRFRLQITCFSSSNVGGIASSYPNSGGSVFLSGITPVLSISPTSLLKILGSVHPIL